MSHDVMCMIPNIGFHRVGGAIMPPVIEGRCEMCELIRSVRKDTVETAIGILQYAHNTTAALGDAGWERLVHDLHGLRKVDTPQQN